MKLAKRLLIMLLTINTALQPMQAHAKGIDVGYGLSVDDYFKKQEQVLSIVGQIRDVHGEQLSVLMDKLDEEILDEGYDYELTYESLHEKGAPELDTDYIGMLAAYMACKEALGTGRPCGFADIEPYTLTVKPASITETIPLRVQEYELTLDGIHYTQNGYHYTLEPEIIPVYEETSDGMFEKTDEEKILKPVSVQTSYGDAAISVAGPECVFEKMGIAQEKVQERFDEIRSYLDYVITNEGIISAFGEDFTYEEAKNAEMSAYMDEAKKAIKEELARQQAAEQMSEWAFINPARYNVVDCASSLVGKVPYLWGGKARKPGYDETWWSYRADGKRNGLDCSGFVQWSYRTAGFPEEVWQKLSSTKQILSTCQTIDQDDLQPGDIGLLNNGESINHCGIYLGDGNYIHCSSGKGTVTVSKFPFKVFKRVQIENINNIDIFNLSEYSTIENYNTINVEYRCDITNEDILLVAKLMMSEAAGEGFNGQAAVAEVVRNRLLSTQFPDNVYDVIYQESDDGLQQFSNNGRIASMIPTPKTMEIAKEVLSGRLSMLEDESVLFYRRPAEGEEHDDWGRYPFFTRINHHTFYSLSN